MPKKKTALTIEERLQQALVPAEEQPYEVPENWVWVRLLSTFTNKTDSKKKIQQKSYLNTGDYAVVDQGQNLIGGYTDDASLQYDGELPVVVFGDHTRCVKYIDFKFVQGADGVKILLPVKSYDSKFFYYAIMNLNIPNMGYRRHFPLFDKLSLPLPPLSEQQRIVERIEELFAKLDEAKERLQEVADSFAVRKAAILHKAFTGELTTQWRRENGVSDESWVEETIGDVCIVNPKKIDAKNLDDNLEVSFVPMAAVSDVFGEIVNHEVKNLQDVRTGFTIFFEGDVIFAKITPCMENGKSAIVGPLVNDIGYGSTEFYVLRCKEELYNKYLYHMVRNTTFRAEAKAVMTGAVGQQRVPKTFLQEYQLLLPSLPEQHEIVCLIDDLLARERSAQQAAEQALASIDLMKKSILARAFRGELGTNKASEASALELLKQVLAEN